MHAWRLLPCTLAAAQTLAVLTSDRHQSGTDRIAEVAAARHWDAATIVVNVQGDEPQLPPALIDQVAALLHEHPQADIATLATPITTLGEFLDPNVVKVVTDDAGLALYFSRAPIPWDRDGAPQVRNPSPARSVTWASMPIVWQPCSD